MKKKLSTLCSILLFSAIGSYGQGAWQHAAEYNDVNNIKAKLMTFGDMWWDDSTGEGRCEFPKGSGKNIGFAGAVWMAGYDPQGQLKVSAQTYRQSGNDYWPGPIDGTASTSLSYSEQWAKIWKINKSTVDSFLSVASHTIANTPAAILTWPAKGNANAAGYNGVALTINNELAPFTDANGDGTYNALDGDYPVLKGDQMLWYVFSDYGATHNQTNSDPLKVEVRVSAYAYQRNTAVDNMIFYEYEVVNKGSSSLDSFRIALWTDFDLGWYNDDFIGFDSSRSLGIGYNGNDVDGFGQPYEYGEMIPMSGVRVLESPDGGCGSILPAGSFMYYNNIDPNPAITDPNNAAQFNHYMRGRWRNGEHLTYGGSGFGGTVETNYVFNGDPVDFAQWSECSSGNLPGDRRFVIATNDYDLQLGEIKKFSFALMATTPDTGNTCTTFGTTSFAGIKALADTAQKIYCNPLLPLPAGINEVAITRNMLHTHPNPSNDLLYITGVDKRATVKLYDAIGRQLSIESDFLINEAILKVNNLPTGIYHIAVADGQNIRSGRFVKQ